MPPVSQVPLAGVPGGRGGKGGEDEEHKRKTPLEQPFESGPDTEIAEDGDEATLDDKGQVVPPPVIGARCHGGGADEGW